MRSESRNLFRFVASLCLAIVPASFTVSSPVDEIDIQPYAGLTVSGSIGTVYSIEYVTNLAHTNDPAAWRCLEFLQLPASSHIWADLSEPISGKRFYRSMPFVAPTNMVFIPPGTFRMGSPTNEVDREEWEGPQTPVTIGRGFWLGQYEVTQGEYQDVMGSNPSSFTGNPNRPVEQVSWVAATNYCALLTLRERASGRISSNSFFRLPSEAEREYACRAWTSTRFSYGDDAGYAELGEYGWYSGNSKGTTHPVGQLLPNPWGLYDMHGNVWEWCLDHGTKLDRQIRGGGWNIEAKFCRSAYFDDFPTAGNSGIGFRVLLDAGLP